MHQLTLLFLLVLGTVVVVPLAERLRLPYPVLLTLYGVLLGWLPFVPDLHIEPDLLLPLLLPPLLYASAQRSSLKQFTGNLRPILLRAVALVVVTTVAVAIVVREVAPEIPLAAAVALGALTSPPDPVAASAVAGRLRLPRRMVSVLEGEGLFNDVTSLVIYEAAITAAVHGTLSWPKALGLLALALAVALAVGLAAGIAGRLLIGVLDDPTLQTVATLLVPYTAYAVADQLKGSGVLAVLVAAFYLGSSTEDADNVVGRLTGRSFWEVVDLVVTGVAFGIIGLESWQILKGTGGVDGHLLALAGAVVGTLVGVRALWLFPASAVVWHLSGDRDDPDDATVPTSARETVVEWWAGMRGVVTIALALALPLTVEGGAPFPARNTLLFVALAVVVVTLVVQGLTLPLVVRWLGVREEKGVFEAERRRMLARAVKAGLRRLDALEEDQDLPDDMVERLRDRHRARLALVSPQAVTEEMTESLRSHAKRVALMRDVEAQMTSAARQEVLVARGERGVDPAVADSVLRRLDLHSLG